MHRLSFFSSGRWFRLTEILTILLLLFFEGIPKEKTKKLRGLIYRLMLAKLGKSASVGRGCEFLNPRLIEIGDGVLIGHGVQLNAYNASLFSIGDQVSLADNAAICGDGNNAQIIIEDQVAIDRGVYFRALENGYIKIGKRSYIAPYVCIGGPGPVTIGQNCLIAAHAGIYANQHNFSDLTIPIIEQGLTSKGIVIEDDCWLGTGVKVLDGVRIGHGSIIGAGAVVTKNIPPYSVAVGVPAKVLHKRGRVSQPSGSRKAAYVDGMTVSN